MKIINVLVFLCFYVSIKAQELQNPSFEGGYGAAITPQEWKPMGQASSPDTQPGSWRVTTPPSHGHSYISMVCRGFSIFDSYLWEACYQPLTNPLFIGKSYHYSIDLAYSNSFLADTISFSNPVNLRIWGMSENEEKEILWESGAVSNIDWETFYFTVTPSIAVDYLILEAYYVELPKYCGNILIDNIQYYPVAPPELIKDTVPEIIVDNDFNFEINENGKLEAINEREIKNAGELVFSGDKLTFTVFDNRTVDGDIISLFLNEKNILKEFTISKDRLILDITTEKGKDYYLTLYAHNLGTIPPNTIALIISDGKKKKLISLTSDLKACGSLKIKIE